MDLLPLHPPLPLSLSLVCAIGALGFCLATPNLLDTGNKLLVAGKTLLLLQEAEAEAAAEDLGGAWEGSYGAAAATGTGTWAR